MAEHLDIAQVVISDSIPARARRLTEKLSALDGFIPSVDFGEVGDAVRRSNVIVTATTATKPHIPRQWIMPGSLVINVSLDDIDEETYLHADLLYVDDWQLITADTQRLLGRMARAGKITGPGQPAPPPGRSVTGTLGQLVAGTCPSRAEETQTVLVNPFGMAIEDLAVAHAIYTVATSRGLGTLLER
jgi:ornithine cyclodeaminase